MSQRPKRKAKAEPDMRVLLVEGTSEQPLRKRVKVEPRPIQRPGPEVPKTVVTLPGPVGVRLRTMSERKTLFVKYLRTILPEEKQQWADSIDSDSPEKWVQWFKDYVIPLRNIGGLNHRIVRMALAKNGVEEKDLGSTPEEQNATVTKLLRFLNLFAQLIADNKI